MLNLVCYMNGSALIKKKDSTVASLRETLLKRFFHSRKSLLRLLLLNVISEFQ